MLESYESVIRSYEDKKAPPSKRTRLTLKDRTKAKVLPDGTVLRKVLPTFECPKCKEPKHAVELVNIKNKWECTTCMVGEQREKEAKERQERLPAETWDSEQGNNIRSRRNMLLDQYRWTVLPDSPLTPQNQQQFLSYLKKLHRLSLDYPKPIEVRWPEIPPFNYAP